MSERSNQLRGLPFLEAHAMQSRQARHHPDLHSGQSPYPVASRLEDANADGSQCRSADR
jgi:hypothetical protein